MIILEEVVKWQEKIEWEMKQIEEKLCYFIVGKKPRKERANIGWRYWTKEWVTWPNCVTLVTERKKKRRKKKQKWKEGDLQIVLPSPIIEDRGLDEGAWENGLIWQLKTANTKGITPRRRRRQRRKRKIFSLVRSRGHFKWVFSDSPHSLQANIEKVPWN